MPTGACWRARRCAPKSAWLREATLRLRRLAAAAPLPLVEQAAIAGALVPDVAQATAAAQGLVQRLDAISLPAERGWKVAADATGLTLARTVRGVAERHLLDAATLRSAEARWLAERTGWLAERFAAPATLRLDAQEVAVAGPAAAFDRILAHGRRGLTVQRFKGLGEMNPDQLWKTTLDPAVRTLLQVKVGDIGGRRAGVRDADGRRGRTAARLHRRQRAEGRQPRRVRRYGAGRRSVSSSARSRSGSGVGRLPARST